MDWIAQQADLAHLTASLREQEEQAKVLVDELGKRDANLTVSTPEKLHLNMCTCLSLNIESGSSPARRGSVLLLRI